MATHRGDRTATARRSRRAYWQGQGEAQRQSGLSQASFCRRRGLRNGTFRFWKWQLAQEARARPQRATSAVRPARPPAFVPIQLASVPVGLRSTPVGEVEIALGPRRCVRVRGPVDPSWLTTVLRAVEALGC